MVIGRGFRFKLEDTPQDGFSRGEGVKATWGGEVAGRDVTVGGHMLHVEEFGNPADAAVLYLHGGPGMGAFHFESAQAERLRTGLRLISVDQRGVLRSAPIADEEAFGVMDIVSDCDALRELLGIEHWSLIGHSFGGYVALLYAMTRPGAVDRLVLENAALDLGSSVRSLLGMAAMEYGAHGDRTQSRDCLALAHSPRDTPVASLWANLWLRLADLGDLRDNLYIHGENKRLVADIMAGSPFPDAWWQRGGVHQSRLVKEGRMFTSLGDCLKEVRQRTLLIKGRYDPVMAGDQIAKYLETKPETELSIFPHSGHFAHLEEPDRFSREILGFLG